MAYNKRLKFLLKNYFSNMTSTLLLSYRSSYIFCRALIRQIHFIGLFSAMVYFSIRAHCLADEREWTKEYLNIVELRRDVFEQFQALNLNDECALIAYFNEQDKCDRILDSLDILPTDRKTVFDVYLKRVSSTNEDQFSSSCVYNRFGHVVAFVLAHLISSPVVFHLSVVKNLVIYNIVLHA